MKNKILALYCRREGRTTMDLPGNETFQGVVVLKKSYGLVTMETVKYSHIFLIVCANNDCVHRLQS
jgi:hypothetical protein